MPVADTPDPHLASPATLQLDSNLDEMERLPAWIDALAADHNFTSKIRFAIDLALEEAVSNVIRHGYKGQPGQPVFIRLTSPAPGHFLFQVEDRAPQLNPLDLPALPAISAMGAIEDIQIGGQGLRLMHEFTSTLRYEAIPGGNRLILGFGHPEPGGGTV